MACWPELDTHTSREFEPFSNGITLDGIAAALAAAERMPLTVASRVLIVNGTLHVYQSDAQLLEGKAHPMVLTLLKLLCVSSLVTCIV